MNCADFENLIALDLTGDLSTGESKQVEAHLSECNACRAFASELSGDLEWLQAGHQQPPDPAALHQVRVGVMRHLESGQSRWNRPFGGLTAMGWRWQWVAATAAVVLLAGIVWWSPSERQPSIAAVDPPEEQQQQRAANSDIVPPPHASENAPRFEPPAEMPQTTDRGPASSQSAEASFGKQPDRPEERQLARRERDAGASAESQAHQDRLGREAQVEIVTALLENPQQEPAETVMLKIPTGNPDIAIYWLMDEQVKPLADEQNKGD